MIRLLRFVLGILASPFKSKSRLEAENAVLRHQLIVLRRKVRGRPRLTNSDRWFFIQLYGGFVDPSGAHDHPSRDAGALAQAGFRCYWCRKSATTGRATADRDEAARVGRADGVPSLVVALTLIDQFHDMIRKKDEAKLDAWIAHAEASLVSCLATGVLKDRAAVRAAIAQHWSSGQVEAQITKLKLVKRQMYGREKIDLLEARLLGATTP
jgi:hypothetical protein